MHEKRTFILLLVGLCFLVYTNSLHGLFVSDDIPTIAKNPEIADWQKLLWNPTGLLNSLNYHIGKFNPFIYHLTNVILHAIACILAFFFLGLFFKTETAFLGAALYAVHPIHTEAVSWISGRGHLILGLFMFALYLLYQHKEKGFIYYLLSLLGFFYIALKSLSLNLFFPFLLVLSDITFGKWRKNWKLWLPFFVVIGLAVFLGRVMISSRVVSVAKEIGLAGDIWNPKNWTNPIYNMAYSFFEHLVLLLWPAKLTLYHEPPVITRILLNWELLGLAVLFFASFLFFLRKAKEIFFALGLYVIFLSPTYSPVMVSWLVAERYAYFPSIAYSILLCFLYERYVKPVTYPKNTRLSAKDAEEIKLVGIRRNRGLSVFIILIAIYSVRTVIRNEDWKTPGRLWRATTEVSFNSPRAHNNMGDAYAQEGNMQGAINEFKKSIELKPDYADAYHNLANIYQFVGNLEEAIVNYQKAIHFNTDLFESRYNLGVIYLNSGQINQAIEQFEKAIKIRPDNTDARYGLKVALEKQNAK